MQPTDKPDPAHADFIRVSDAKRLYFGGTMSLRWWYKQVELGVLPHFRAGGAVLLRPSDVEAFVAEMFSGKAAEPEPEPPATVPTRSPKARSSRSGGGLRFFTS
jgi:hypothetical protein